VLFLNDLGHGANSPGRLWVGSLRQGRRAPRGDE
jgi:hypothetical protein